VELGTSVLSEPKTLPEAINECRQMGAALDAFFPELMRWCALRLVCAGVCVVLGVLGLGDRSSWINWACGLTNFASAATLLYAGLRDWCRWAKARGSVAAVLHWLLEQYSDKPISSADGWVWNYVSADVRRMLGVNERANPRK
jgi:hypothetical protein